LARSGDLRVARRRAASRTWARRVPGVLAGRIAARILVLEPGRGTRRLSLRSRVLGALAPDDEPAGGRAVAARRADTAPLRELRRRVDSRLPVRAGGGRPIPDCRDGARRP